MTGAGLTTSVLTFRKLNKNSLEHRDSTCRSIRKKTPYTFYEWGFTYLPFRSTNIQGEHKVFLLHWRHFDTSRLCNWNITINKRHNIYYKLTYVMAKKYVCVPRSFLVTNVCNQGKTLCSPCILKHSNIKDFIYLFDLQSVYTVFRKLMCWQESSLWTFWRDEIPSSEGISYSWLQVSWPSSFRGEVGFAYK